MAEVAVVLYITDCYIYFSSLEKSPINLEYRIVHAKLCTNPLGVILSILFSLSILLALLENFLRYMI